jgi:flagellin
MSSIMTNTAAMAALATLRSINDDMSMTQNRISSGYRVETASDNAAYWSIATTMRSDNGALSTVQDALGLGAAKVDVAYTGMNSAIEVVKEIKNKLVLASEPSTDLDKINEEVTALQAQLKTIVSSAQFNGENLLASDATSTTIVTSFDRDSSGNVSVSSITYELTATGTLLTSSDYSSGGLLEDILAMDLSTYTAADRASNIAGDLTDVETALSAMTDAAAGPRRDLQAHRTAGRVCRQPDGCHRLRRRPSRRCRHERRVDPPQGAADPAAAWYSGAVDRQLELREHPPALPLRVRAFSSEMAGSERIRPFLFRSASAVSDVRLEPVLSTRSRHSWRWPPNGQWRPSSRAPVAVRRLARAGLSRDRSCSDATAHLRCPA